MKSTFQCFFPACRSVRHLSAVPIVRIVYCRIDIMRSTKASWHPRVLNCILFVWVFPSPSWPCPGLH